MMNISERFLMPRSFRLVGIVFFITGLLFGIARFKFGLKPDALDLKMFAFYSAYLESKYMQFITNNLGEEITGILLIAGLFLMAFSREKSESEMLTELRLRSFFISAYVNFIFLAGSFIFTFGFAFVYMLMVNMGVGLLAYLVTFRLLVYRSHNQLFKDSL